MKKIMNLKTQVIKVIPDNEKYDKDLYVEVKETSFGVFPIIKEDVWKLVLVRSVKNDKML